MVVSFFQWVLSPVVDFLQKLVWKMPKDKSVKQAKKTNGLVDKYLLIYNAVSCVAWGYTAFVRVIANIGDYPSTYSQIGNTLLILQTFALLEVFHALFKLVRSPVFTTAMQVASRLTMVWAVCNQFPEVANDWAYSTMALAWGLTEIIRYSFYALNLLGSDSEYFSFLTWCRYHFFYILYPVGAGSEYWLILAANKIAKENPDQKVLSYFFTFCQFIWPVGFYIMYSHMIKQRTKFVKDAKEKKEAAKKAKKAE
ncbi:hypothetical protein HDU79_007749 [Rhizoclosmatium sp. JEL0117]|nr:hypothetical protein HDU79_007749 [Rhizoclosmatium sp. JEL0117]